MTKRRDFTLEKLFESQIGFEANNAAGSVVYWDLRVHKTIQLKAKFASSRGLTLIFEHKRRQEPIPRPYSRADDHPSTRKTGAYRGAPGKRVLIYGTSE